MPDFAALLSDHIHNKNIKTYALAQYCNLDRSNMYKIIKGQRKPSSLEIVEKICKFMHLSPSEQKEMEEAYHIALVGREEYYRRKAVQQFFEEFRLPARQLPATSPAVAPDYADNTTLLHSHHEINRSLLYIISSELKKAGGKIQLLIPPDYSFLMNVLTAGDYASSSVDIQHIICLNNSQNVSLARQNYNLNCLKRILPLYSNHYRYNCYYYYDDIDAVASAFTLFPYAVITTEYACLVSSDMQSGFIAKDPESLRLFSYLFEQYLTQAAPLLRPVTDLPTQLKCVETTTQNITEGYFFQMVPCLTRFLTIELLDKYIIQELPHREEILSLSQQYLLKSQAIPDSADLTFICSLDGIRKFLDTGRVGEYPSHVYNPLDFSDRILLIRQLADSFRNEHNRMLKRAIGLIDHEFYLFAGRQSGYFMFQPPDTGRMIYLNIEEPGMLFTFFDFCDTLDEEMFFTPEEAYEKVQELIREAQTK